MVPSARSLVRHAAVLIGLVLVPVAGRGAESVFTPVSPCRMVDTRASPDGPLLPNVVRSFSFWGFCGVPFKTSDGGRESNVATALALNIVAVGPAAAGHLVVWAA